jgi:hypothetical protein
MSQEVAYRGFSMAMNGVDYTKQLSKDREYFQDANKKLRDATEKRVEDTEKRADHVMTKQRENFIEDKAELEGNYQTNLNKLKDKTASSLENTSSKSHEQLEKERENFTQESLKKSKDFDQRLNDIKSSYSKAFDSEKDRNEDLEKTHKTKYERNISSITQDTDEKLKNYQDRMSSEGTSLKDQSNRERQQLVRAQEDRLTDAYKDAAHKRAELKDHINYENKKRNEVHTAEMDQQKQYTNDRLSTIQNKFQDRYEGMSKDYSQRSENLASTQQNVAKQVNREHQDKISDVQRGYNDNLKKIELEKRRRNNGSGEFSEVVERQQGLKEKVVQENKINRLKDDLATAQKTFETHSTKERVNYGETLKEQSVEATARQDKKLNEANADKIVTVTREREKATKEVNNREHQNRLDKSAYESQLMNERSGATERLKKLKENFNQSLTTLEEKHNAANLDVTKVANNDKAEFMKKAQEQRSNEIFEMKRAFGKMMDATVQDYETRLATYQRDNEYLKMNMNQKVQNIIDQTEKQLTSQKTLFDDRKKADDRDQQILMDQRENQLKRNFSDMNITYQKKIDKMQMENDSKFKLMVNDYETKLKEQKALTSKEIVTKDTSHQIELDRTKQAYEDEKTRIVNAYESQIESMKNGHTEAMKQMQDFKKLS